MKGEIPSYVMNMRGGRHCVITALFEIILPRNIKRRLHFPNLEVGSISVLLVCPEYSAVVALYSFLLPPTQVLGATRSF
jgi:hypothetical protein